MPFQLSGYDEFSRYRALLANAFAISRTFNERNLEFPWYGLWNLHLCTLIGTTPNVFVVPQLPLWVEIDDMEGFELEEEGVEDGDEPEEGVGDEPEEESDPGESSATFLEDELVDSAADLSFSSTTSSYHVKNPTTRIPDFAIVWADGERTTRFPARYLGWRVFGVVIPAIVEVKRLPSRSLKGKALEKEMQRKMQKAQFALLDQANHLFARYPDTDSVVAIAAVGPYWRSMTIRRAQGLPKWNLRLKIHSAQSDRRFNTILKRIERLGNDRESLHEDEIFSCK